MRAGEVIVIPYAQPTHTGTAGCRYGNTCLWHVDVEVEGEAAAGQHRQVRLVRPVLTDPRDGDGEHCVDGAEDRHCHVEALQSIPGSAHTQWCEIEHGRLMASAAREVWRLRPEPKPLRLDKLASDGD